MTVVMEVKVITIVTDDRSGVILDITPIDPKIIGYGHHSWRRLLKIERVIMHNHQGLFTANVGVAWHDPFLVPVKMIPDVHDAVAMLEDVDSA